MTDILATKIDDYAIDMKALSAIPTENMLDYNAAISVEGAWLAQSLEDLIQTGEYAGVTMTAADAIVMVADKIETNGVPLEGQKAIADLLRYLAQFALVRPIPMS